MQKILFIKLQKKSFLIIQKQITERNLNKNNKTPLHIAAENDSIKIGELLILKGADINIKFILYQITKTYFSSFRNKLKKGI